MTQATVVSLQICPARRAPMQTVTQVRAVANLGLEGDCHAIPNAKRQVLLMPLEVLEALRLEPAQVKENITTRGLDVMALSPGARLRIGSAEFEITLECDPCGLMDDLRPGLQDELARRRGMLARVVQSGELRVGDPIEALPAAP